VTAQKLDRTLTAYRIGDPDGAFPIFDAAGSRLFPGRWNLPETPVIYASEHYSTALLEKLVHAAIGKLPPNQHFIGITLPRGLSYEVVAKDSLPGWDDRSMTAARRFGAAWIRERQSAILMVPSIVARMERNIVINPAHPEFGQIETTLAEPVWWDERLFGRP
jgi:RES domain-containing protein